MSRRYVLALALLVLAIALGCGGGQPPATGSGDPGGSPSVGPAADAAPDDKELAELDRQIEAKEKELTTLRAKADALRAKIAAKQPAGDAVPLLELLGRFPKDRWPKDKTDSLRIEQAKQWYGKNAVGRRVIIVVPAEAFSFSSEGDGKWLASAGFGAGQAEMMGGKWGVSVGGGLKVKGLSGADAERLRALPKDTRLEVVANLTGVGLYYDESGVVVELANPQFKGTGP